MTDRWKLRATLLAQRFRQPTGACMTIMPGSIANLSSLLALAAPYLFEDPARRIRALWARRFGNAR